MKLRMEWSEANVHCHATSSTSACQQQPSLSAISRGGSKCRRLVAYAVAPDLGGGFAVQPPALSAATAASGDRVARWLADRCWTHEHPLPWLEMRRDQHGVDDRHRTRFQNARGIEIATAQAARVAGGLAALVAGRREAGLGVVVAAGAVAPGDGQRARLAERVLRVHGVAAGAEAARGDLTTAKGKRQRPSEEVRGAC